MFVLRHQRDGQKGRRRERERHSSALNLLDILNRVVITVQCCIVNSASDLKTSH